ncbi:hypothetical protein, partial [uncultured Rikenella sp.]|uniref:hypothetical protein n=1 Tax=uncultured Rikenella sp. TaxID=368003 RepID=UPI0026327D8A
MQKTFSTILHFGISLVTLLILLFAPLISVGFNTSINGSNVLSMFFRYGLPDNEFQAIIIGTLGVLIFTIVTALLDLPKETKAIGIVRLIMNVFQFIFAVLLTGLIAEGADSFPGAIVLTCFAIAGLIVAIVLLATFRKRHKASSE